MAGENLLAVQLLFMPNPGHLDFIRTQPCCRYVPFVQDCSGPTQAHHHTGGRGRGQKSEDERSMPLCSKHHREFHSATGAFGGWRKTERREWQDRMVELYKPDPDVF